MNNKKRYSIILLATMVIVWLSVLGATTAFIGAERTENNSQMEINQSVMQFEGIEKPPFPGVLHAHQPLGMLETWFLYFPLVLNGRAQESSATATPTEDLHPTVTETATEELSPTPTLTPTHTRTPQPGMPRDGQWSGEVITDGYPEEIQNVNFTVESSGLQITTGARIDTYYYIESGYWVCSGTVEWTVKNSIPINPDGSFHYSGGIVDKLTWDGSFLSETSAQGTFHIEKQTYVCGKAIHDGTWWAEWQEIETR
jgi:hypothetical protein